MWSLPIEPTYQTTIGSSEVNLIFGYTTGLAPSNPSGGTGYPIYYKKKIKYSSIELPLVVRHYFYLKNATKLFINTGINFDFPISFTDEITTAKSSPNFLLGFGYSFKEKYNIEVRYYTPKKILSEFNKEYTNFNNISLKFSYKLN